MERFKAFMNASANVISDNHAYRPSSLFEDVRDMRLQTIADGKRNMRGDFMSFGKSFKIATKEAQKKVCPFKQR